ncbi:unnamed protein product [Mytilus edulis]|uniref:Uncharacterized protein n=1 Tax=Mytilus edulis TaxID=6550 RepID=A0A8S3QZ37_MYTED|nr:unnamed protein product [Mytilus edulis]
MREYLAARGVNVTHLRYFDKQNRRTASAQLNIDAQCETLIRDPSFWPEGIFLKEWLPCISLHVQDFAKGPVCTFQSYEDGPKTGIDHIVTNTKIHETFTINEMDKAYNEHIMNIANRMEESIDNDQRYVWSVLKSRRKQKTVCRELNLNRITHAQERLVYLILEIFTSVPDSSTFNVTGVPNSTAFDVSLMICLIRNLAFIINPTHGFDILPPPEETTQDLT